MNWDRIDVLYELEAPSREELALKRLFNLVIHSFVFVVAGDPDDHETLDGFYLNSDQTRQSLWRLEWRDFLVLHRKIVEDDIVSAQMERNEHGEMVYVMKRGPSATGLEHRGTPKIG